MGIHHMIEKRIIKTFFLTLIFSGGLAAAAGALGSSTSYVMTAGIFDSAGTVASSASYKLLGKLREQQLTVYASASYYYGAGFLRSVYFARQIILSPVVTLIAPNSGTSTGPVTITNLGGANFQSGAAVKLSKSGQTDIVAYNVQVQNTGQIACVIDLTGAAPGAWDVTVTNPDGRSGTLPAAFTVSYPAPTVTGITPASGVNNAVVNITNLAGTNFRAGAAVKLSLTGQPDIPGTAVTVVSPTKITCSIDLTGKGLGSWDVIVTNNDGQGGTLAGGFKVEAATIYVTQPVVSTQNPFNPSVGATSINYSLSKNANITIYIYNMRGERIWQQTAAAGSPGGVVGANALTWDGITAFKATVPEGVYIVDVTTQDGGYHLLSRTKIAVVR
jgi:hypothetical protein